MRPYAYAIVLLLALATGRPAHAAASTPWLLYAETMLNSESNIEAALGAEVGRWYVDLRARDAQYYTATGRTCRTYGVCHIGTDDELEYEGRMGLTYWLSERVSHGPVVGYTKRAGGADTWAAGWRVTVGRP